MDDNHRLKYLNISYNGGDNDKTTELDEAKMTAQYLLSKMGKSQSASKLESILAHFIHYSNTLIHLDISNLPISTQSYMYIAKFGLRKSRSLLSCHMESVGFL